MWIFNESILSLKLDRLQEVTDLNLLDRFEQIAINCIYQAAAFWNLKSIIFCIWHWNQFVWSINFGSGMKSKESGKGIFTSYNVWTVRCAVGQNTNTNVYKYTLGSVFEQCFFFTKYKDKYKLCSFVWLLSCGLGQKAEYVLQGVKTSGAKWHSCRIFWHFTLTHCRTLWYFTLTYCRTLWHFYIDTLVTTLDTVNTLLFFGVFFLRSIGQWLIKEKTGTITFETKTVHWLLTLKLPLFKAVWQNI